MNKVRIYERMLYDHFVVIMRGDKVERAERKGTLDSWTKLAEKMLDWFTPLNGVMKRGPYYDVWIMRDRGNRYECNGFVWSPRTCTWVQVDDDAPIEAFRIIEAMRKEMGR